MRLAYHDNTTKDYRRARGLRNNVSPIEQKLWRILREAAKIAGLRFRRQQPLHPYIADFACMSAKLLVELDGDTHAESEGYDRMRDAKLRSMGYNILRFCNDDVVRNAEGVAAAIIEKALLLNAPLPAPPREGEGNLSCGLLLEKNGNA